MAGTGTAIRCLQEALFCRNKIGFIQKAFEWHYLPQKDFWIVTQIGGIETNLTLIDPHDLPDKCLFRMIAAEQEENRVHIFIPTKNGDTKSEWRFFTDFFTGLIRNGDIT